MPINLSDQELNDIKSRMIEASSNDDLDGLDELVNDKLAIGDVSHLIESVPSPLRAVIWNQLDEDLHGEVLSNLNEDIQHSILTQMTAEEIVETTQFIARDDLADLLQQLPSDISNQVLNLMPPEERSKVEGLLAYPENTAGGLMDSDAITIRSDVTIETVLRYLRKKALPDNLDTLWVVDRDNRYLGSLAITKLLQSHPEVLVETVMATDIDPILVTEPDAQVAHIFERHDLVSAPVIDTQGILIGRITVDDVVDVIREVADHNMLGMAGLDEEEDVFSPIVRSSRNRAVWLGINMITAFIAAAVMSQFEASIAEIVALAVLSPVVASMGGIAGSQTLTLMIRGIATGHITRPYIGWMFWREAGVGALNGMLWGLVIAIITLIWYQQWQLSLVIFSAVLANICAAVCAGTLLPFLLKSIGIDPALSGNVILTTLTDVFGFLTFLGLATLFLLS